MKDLRAAVSGRWSKDHLVELFDCSFDDIGDWLAYAERWPFPLSITEDNGICEDECDVPKSIAEFFLGPANLDGDRLHFFQNVVAPWLVDRGHRVLTTRFESRQRSVQLRYRFRRKGRPNGTGEAARCYVDCELLLDGEPVDPAILQSAAEQKRAHFESDGVWVAFDASNIDAILGLHARAHGGDLTLSQALRWGERASEFGDYVDERGIRSGSLLELLTQRLASGDAEAPDSPPLDLSAFAGELRPYQRDGVIWMAHRAQLGLGVCLADEMGLGKTWQALALIVASRLPDEPRPTLVVCPASVVPNWRDEARRLAPGLTVCVHHGVNRANAREIRSWDGTDHLIITTYEVMARDVQQLSAVWWRRLILDEAQQIKNRTSLRTQRANDLGKSAAQRVAITGTPLENSPDDLWTILDFLNPGVMGSLSDFRRHIEGVRVGAVGGAHGQYRDSIGSILLRRTKKEVAPDLPDKIEMSAFCNLTVQQATLYNAAVDVLLENLMADPAARHSAHILRGITRLKQICDHPALAAPGSFDPNESGKVLRLFEILDEVEAARESALVFTQYVKMGRALQVLLTDRYGPGTEMLDGQLRMDRRQELVDRFQSGGLSRLVISLRAGGIGVTLTAARHVIHFDRWWNPAVEDQATDRAHRIGQQRIVEVHRMISVGTLEERIDAMLREKSELASLLVAPSGDLNLGSMTLDELHALLSLSSGEGREG